MQPSGGNLLYFLFYGKVDIKENTIVQALGQSKIVKVYDCWELSLVVIKNKSYNLSSTFLGLWVQWWFDNYFIIVDFFMLSKQANYK